MPLNLITDPWISVLARDGTRRTIAPWQMADRELDRPNWPRADLDLACTELLIGLVFLADPPLHDEDWRDPRAPDPDRLRKKLIPYAPAFDLLGEGPRFGQELGGLEGEALPPDALFIDSAGASTAKNNADLMARRGRYDALDPALAAMALHALQSQAPSGGAGNRTSMRGGGPMVTLVDPGRGLWEMVWANVPHGAPAPMEALPWMRPTRVSQAKGSERYPQDGHPVEAFFGMSRRLRLVSDEAGRITGVVQKPWGVNYAMWAHPLTPHYRMKAGAELLPKHPRAGRFGYRQWLGVTVRAEQPELAEQARSLRNWGERGGGEAVRVLVAGWSMDNMKPRDFLWAQEPLLRLSPEAEERLRGMIEAADRARSVLRAALVPVVAEGSPREALLEEFYLVTEGDFLSRARALAAEAPDFEAVMRGWLDDMRGTALSLFDARAVPGLHEAAPGKAEAIVAARRNLGAAFAGRTETGGKAGGKMFGALNLPVPTKREKAE